MRAAQFPYLLGVLMLLLSTWSTPSVAQSEAYLNEDRQTRTFDRNHWRETVKDIDYSGDQGEMEKEKEEDEFGEYDPPPRRGLGLFGAGGFRIFAIICLVALVVIVLFILLNRNLLSPSNQKVGSANITIDNIEDHLEETEFDRFIREALENGQYALAIRLYYLAILQALSAKDMIAWKRDKTNGEYLREMRTTPQFSDFRACTYLYERVWYGEREIDAVQFEQLQTRFQNLLQQLT